MVMKNMTTDRIAKACHGRLVNGEASQNREITGAVIDSRLVEKDYLFFAHKGEKADGHDYIDAVFEKGALCVVCEKLPEKVNGTCIVVEDTLEALRDIAEFYRRSLDIKVVGITGSVGKTSTKEFIASVLAQKYEVLKTEGNHNNLVGLPLTVLRIRDNHEVAVLEMGISEFGEMEKLSEIAHPDICVITNIGDCHLEHLKDRNGVLKAKTEIFRYMNPNGDVCLFGDDALLATIKEVNGRDVLFFGQKESNKVHTVKVNNKGLLGSECVIDNGEEQFGVSVPLPGIHMVNNALAASAVAKLLAVPVSQINSGIKNVRSVSGRSNIIQKNGLTIIDDCYNANPASMRSALDLLAEAVTPKVAILGDMFEQGENEKKGHLDVGEYAARKDIETIVCIGSLSKDMYERAAAFSRKSKVDYDETVAEAIANLTGFIKKDDTVLVKASNGMGFARIIAAITDDNMKNAFDSREEKLFK